MDKNLKVKNSKKQILISFREKNHSPQEKQHFFRPLIKKNFLILHYNGYFFFKFFIVLIKDN